MDFYCHIDWIPHCKGFRINAWIYKVPQTNRGWRLKYVSYCVFSDSFFYQLWTFVSLFRPVTEIVADIHQGNWLRFGANGLKELCKLLPDESEVLTTHIWISVFLSISVSKQDYFGVQQEAMFWCFLCCFSFVV